MTTSCAFDDTLEKHFISGDSEGGLTEFVVCNFAGCVSVFFAYLSDFLGTFA